MNTRLRLGIVGIGPHFRETLFPALIQTNFSLRAVCDTLPEAQQWASSKIGNCLVSSDFKDNSFWDNIDCVMCCSSPFVHEEVLARAITLKKPCFCEKPAASSSRALDSLIARGTKGLVLKIGHVFRYTIGGEGFIDHMRESDAKCLMVHHLASKPRGPRWGIPSRRSFALSHLTHALDFIIASVGNITHIHSSVWNTYGDAESVTACFKTARCSHVTLCATNAAPAFMFKAHGVRQDGSAADLESLNLVRITGLTPTGKRSGPMRQMEVGDDCFRDELRSFEAFSRGGGHCRLPNLDDARHVLSVIEELDK